MVWANPANYQDCHLWPFLPSGKGQKSLKRKATAPDNLPITLVGAPRSATAAEVAQLLNDNGIQFVEGSMLLYGQTARFTREINRGHGVDTASITVNASNNETLWQHILGIKNILWMPKGARSEYQIFIYPSGSPQMWLRLNVVTTPDFQTASGERFPVDAPRLIVLRLLHELGYSEGGAAQILTYLFDNLGLPVLAVAFDSSPLTIDPGVMNKPPITWYDSAGGLSLLFRSVEDAEKALEDHSKPSVHTRSSGRPGWGQEYKNHTTFRVNLTQSAEQAPAASELSRRGVTLSVEGTRARWEAFSLAGQLSTRGQPKLWGGSAPLARAPVTEEELPRTVYVGNLPVKEVSILFQIATGTGTQGMPRSDQITATWLRVLNQQLGLEVGRIALPLTAAGVWDIGRGAWIVLSDQTGEGVRNAQEMVRRINLPMDHEDSLQRALLAAIPVSGGDPIFVQPERAFMARMEANNDPSNRDKWISIRPPPPARPAMGRGPPGPPAFGRSAPTYAMVVSPTKTSNAARAAGSNTGQARTSVVSAGRGRGDGNIAARRSLNQDLGQAGFASVAISPASTDSNAAIRSQNSRLTKLEDAVQHLTTMLEQVLEGQHNSPARQRKKRPPRPGESAVMETEEEEHTNSD